MEFSALVPWLIGVGVALAGLVARKVAFAWLHRRARTTQTRLDDIVISALRGSSVLWAMALAVYMGVAFSPLDPQITRYAHKAISILLIGSFTLAAGSVLSQLVLNYAKSIGFPAGTTGLAQGVVKGVVLVVGGLLILSNLGISITPLITALGVGGLAVALALQDTLANFFSGIHIMAERPVRVGDYIKLASGEEGYVVDIGWRSTRLRQLPNNLVIIPNRRLADTIITNYYLPEKRMSLLIPIGVSYVADPEQVERVLVEEAKAAVGEVPGLLGEPEPFVRFIPGFGDFSLNFTLIVQVREFVDQYLVQHELRKRILRRFRQEGIEIPFPIRTVYLRDERGGVGGRD